MELERFEFKKIWNPICVMFVGFKMKLSFIIYIKFVKEIVKITELPFYNYYKVNIFNVF